MLRNLVLGSFVLVLVSCADAPSTMKIYGSKTATATNQFYLLSNQFGRLVASTCDGCAGSPETMSIKLYSLYLSTNADCSSPTLVVDNGATAVTKELSVNPILFEASPTTGTYNCMILKISDNLNFTPDADAAAAFPSVCRANTETTFDIYRTDSGDTWKNLNGAAIDPSGTTTVPAEDTVFVFASTNVSAVTATSIAPHENQTAALTGALIVPGQSTFYVDFAGGVRGGERCSIEGGRGLGFRE